MRLEEMIDFEYTLVKCKTFKIEMFEGKYRERELLVKSKTIIPFIKWGDHLFKCSLVIDILEDFQNVDGYFSDSFETDSFEINSFLEFLIEIGILLEDGDTFTNYVDVENFILYLKDEIEYCENKLGRIK